VFHYVTRCASGAQVGVFGKICLPAAYNREASAFSATRWRGRRCIPGACRGEAGGSAVAAMSSPMVVAQGAFPRDHAAVEPSASLIQGHEAQATVRILCLAETVYGPPRLARPIVGLPFQRSLPNELPRGGCLMDWSSR